MPEVFRAPGAHALDRDRGWSWSCSGMLCFYVTYVSYRNLKSQLPFVEGKDHKFDRELFTIDKALFFGHDARRWCCTACSATGCRAEVLSTVYLWFLPLVPLALAAWLVWSRNLGYGYWFATSQCIAWTLGTISYYALPTLGPGFQYPLLYADDPEHRRRAADELPGQQPGLGGQHQRNDAGAAHQHAQRRRRLRQPARRDHAAGGADDPVHDDACAG